VFGIKVAAVNGSVTASLTNHYSAGSATVSLPIISNEAESGKLPNPKTLSKPRVLDQPVFHGSRSDWLEFINLIYTVSNLNIPFLLDY
jgi:hypothetical protein